MNLLVRPKVALHRWVFKDGGLQRAQRAVLAVTFAVGRALRPVRRPLTWVIGVLETAQMIAHMGAALPGSYTVALLEHAFYQHRYDAVLRGSREKVRFVRRYFFGPAVLGWQAARARGVIYVSRGGFLDSSRDERAAELAFLRARGRHVVTVFTGTDIRSPRLSLERAQRDGAENIGSILFRQGPPFDSDELEQTLRRRAEVADRHASAIVSPQEDQPSYITRDTWPFLYFFPDEEFAGPTGKFDDLSAIRIVHAPSNPALKGTDAFREAVRRLQAEFPEVEYTELSGVKNVEVAEALDKAHIALNQLHASMPGMFGIEAMAHRCVMVCSASSAKEPQLAESDGAWVVADVGTVYDRLRDLVADRTRLAAQAERGWHWAWANASRSGAGAQLRALLASLDAPRR